MENLHNKTALVTGAARRIGRSLALGLAASGADVAIRIRARRRRQNLPSMHFCG